MLLAGNGEHDSQTLSVSAFMPDYFRGSVLNGLAGRPSAE